MDPIPAQLLELQTRIDAWRAERKYLRQPLPDDLRKAVLELSGRYPPSLLRRVLKIDPWRLSNELAVKRSIARYCAKIDTGRFLQSSGDRCVTGQSLFAADDQRLSSAARTTRWRTADLHLACSRDFSDQSALLRLPSGPKSMIQLVPQLRILLAYQPVDFRNGIDGLAALCRRELDSDAFDGSVFVFRNRRGTALKILTFDGHGYWLFTRRFAKGTLQWWPKPQSETRVHLLQAQQLSVLLYNGLPEQASFVSPWRALPSHSQAANASASGFSP